MNGFLTFINGLYWEIGYAVCHQLPKKSLFFGGRQLPLCARDTGIYLGALLTLAILFLIYRKNGKSYPSWKIMLLMGALILPAIVDGLTTYAGWRASSNQIRLGTGLLAGVGLAALLFPLLSREFFPSSTEETILTHPLELITLPLAAGALYLFLQVEWKGSYWFWSTLLCASVVLWVAILGYTLLSPGPKHRKKRG